MDKMHVGWYKMRAGVKKRIDHQSESPMLMTLWLGAAATFFITTFLLTLLSGTDSFSLSVSISIVSEWAA